MSSPKFHAQSATAGSDREHLERLFERLHAVIRAIPRGRVATYGQVAELAELPGGARIAAASLKGKRATALPWYRVIGKASTARGRIKILDPIGAAIQRQLLEEEGVDFGDSGLVKLDVFGWIPTVPGGRLRRSVRDR